MLELQNNFIEMSAVSFPIYQLFYASILVDIHGVYTTLDITKISDKITQQWGIFSKMIE